jgi:hypothetical protein
MFAMKIGLRFGIPDFWSILEWPEGLFEYWRAHYNLEPWDFDGKQARNEYSLAKYKLPPKLISRKHRTLSGREIKT